MKSILQKNKECYVCKSLYVEDHHIYFGPNRKISEKHGFKVWLCNLHHTGSISGNSKNAVHFNRDMNLRLKKECQRKYEEEHTRDEFIKLIGRSYL